MRNPCFPKHSGNTYGDIKTAVKVTGWLNCQQQTSPLQEAHKNGRRRRGSPFHDRN